MILCRLSKSHYSSGDQSTSHLLYTDQLSWAKYSTDQIEKIKLEGIVIDLVGVGSLIHQPLSQVPVHVMIIDGMVVIVQSIEFRATTVLTLNAEETFHAIQIQSPSLLMIFSGGGRYTELNYSVSFGKE